MDDLATVRTFSSRIEAEMAKGLLETNGINSVITADDGGGMTAYPMAYAYGAELKVRNEDLEKANKILMK